MANFSIEAEIDALFRQKMKEFADWATANWGVTEKEVECLTVPTSDVKAYTSGYNAAIGSITDALDCWLEEFGV